MRNRVPNLERPNWPVFALPTLLKFIISGASTAVLFLVICFALSKAGLSPFLASIVAYGIAFAVGYRLQRGWTFDARHGHASALPRYFALQAGCALLSGLVSQQGVLWLHLSPLPMATLTALVTGSTSFAVSRYWVFPHEKLGTEQSV